MDRKTVTNGLESPQSPYAILGDDGIKQLADALYNAMDRLPDAAEIRAMHASNLAEIKRKLATYLVGWMGGPPVYLAMNGTVCLTDVHEPFKIGAKQRDQWLMCMDYALEEIGASQELRELLREPMYRIADTVKNTGGNPAAQPTSEDDSRIIARG